MNLAKLVSDKTEEAKKHMNTIAKFIETKL